MNRYHIYKVNGLGKKVEVATVLADSFDYLTFGTFDFFQDNRNWFGNVTSRSRIHHFSGDGVCLIVKD